jgi:hypothetical protein
MNEARTSLRLLYFPLQGMAVFLFSLKYLINVLMQKQPNIIFLNNQIIIAEYETYTEVKTVILFKLFRSKTCNWSSFAVVLLWLKFSKEQTD